jgi:hypothetical protein
VVLSDGQKEENRLYDSRILKTELSATTFCHRFEKTIKLPVGKKCIIIVSAASSTKSYANIQGCVEMAKTVENLGVFSPVNFNAVGPGCKVHVNQFTPIVSLAVEVVQQQ